MIFIETESETDGLADDNDSEISDLNADEDDTDVDGNEDDFSDYNAGI